GGQIGGDLFPGHAIAARAVQKLRSVVEDLGIMRRGGHWRNSLHSIDEIASGIAVQRLRADPVILLLSRLEVHDSVLSLARSVDDVGILWMGHDGIGLAAGAGTRVIARGGSRPTGGDKRRLVRLRAV